MAAVTFDPEEFKSIYPQFSDFDNVRLEYFFSVASILVDSSERSIVPFNPPKNETLKIILYLLVCHFCELSIRGGGLVGSLSSASEGSVSTGFTVPTNPNAVWYNQTQCGATAWQLMQPFILGGRSYNGCFR